jgi:hypothetical protein
LRGRCTFPSFRKSIAAALETISFSFLFLFHLMI